MLAVYTHVWPYVPPAGLRHSSSMAATHTEVKGLFSFFRLCGKLKDPETVAGHMYRMAMMGFLFQGIQEDESASSVDRDRCIRMSLVHDLAESIVGDLTPYDGVSKVEKYRRELEAMEHIKTLVPQEVGTELFGLWKEYEDGISPEAIIVKDLDRFDMIFQAFEYEKAQDKPYKLQQFFDSTKDKFKHPTVKKWAEELVQERSNND